MDATKEITELLEDVAESVKTEDLDTAEEIEAYGRAERARGVVLAFRAAHEQRKSANDPDETVPLRERLREAVDALQGRETAQSKADAAATLDRLAVAVDESGDVIDAHAEDLGQDLANRHGGDGETGWMFQ